jgi:hypothetical protein
MTEYETFIRDAAQKRGIDPNVAVKVANSEGGVTEPARRGTFATGSSWWAFQLHYGGQGYEHFGTVAGMGNGFTALTKWQPGDPKAWRDAARYALNRVKAGGWGPWYGAAAAGVGKWDGIDRSAMWDANAERWDYEGAVPVTGRVTYDREHRVHPQDETYDCSQESLEWALHALGRQPSDDWLEQTMIAEGVMSPEVGLTDATGAGLAAFVVRHYGEFGYLANNEKLIYWAPVRADDPVRKVLLLANPADGWGGVGQTMTEAQFRALGPFSAVRVWHPDLLAAEPEPPPATDTRLARARTKLQEAIAILDEAAP